MLEYRCNGPASMRRTSRLEVSWQIDRNSPMKSSANTRKLAPKQEAVSSQTTAERFSELAKDQKLARLVAANPSAPPDLLSKLSRSNDKPTRSACAANSSTPVEALLELGSQFPEQLIENPVFDLLILGNPDIFAELPVSTVNSLLKRDVVPVELIRWAWKNHGHSTLESLLLNPSTPADIVNELCHHESNDVRIAAELHCSRELPEWARTRLGASAIEISEIYEQLAIPYSAKLDDVILSVLSNCRGARLDELLRLIPDEVFLEFAHGKKASAQALELLSVHPSDNIREVVARNPRTPGHSLLDLAKDKSYSVRASVAYIYQDLTKEKIGSLDEKTLAELLMILLNDKHEYVRHWIPMSKILPKDILGSLAKDPSDMVRVQVAKNPRTPIEAIRILASDSSQKVRQWIARHAATPSELLAKLGRDEDSEVRRQVATNVNTPPDVLALLSEDDDPAIRCRVALNKCSPRDVLERLASDADKDVLHGIGRNVETPSEIVLKLSRHSSAGVRSGAALNPKAPAEILHKLADDASKNVREAAALNKATPVEALERLAQDSVERIRFEVARNQSATDAIFAKLAEDSSIYVRSMVAENSRTPLHVLETLAKDRSNRVSKEASKNLQAQTQDEDDANANELFTALSLDEVCDQWCKGAQPTPIRRFLLQLPECPAPLLAKNLRSRSWLERLAIAQNPSTPEATLKKMVSDGNHLVHHAASLNLARRSSMVAEERL